jgi:hypothetical protein
MIKPENLRSVRCFARSIDFAQKEYPVSLEAAVNGFGGREKIKSLIDTILCPLLLS